MGSLLAAGLVAMNRGALPKSMFIERASYDLLISHNNCKLSWLKKSIRIIRNQQTMTCVL